MKVKQYKEEMTFLNCLRKLNPIEIVGVGLLLGVTLLENEAQEVKFEDGEALNRLLEGFKNATERTRKRLLKIMKDATR